MINLRAITLALICTSALVACGSPPPPVPTLAPTSPPAPTTAPLPVEPTVAALGAVTIDRLEVYSHPDGLFSMQVPQGWSFKDRSNDDLRMYAWSDQAQNAQIVVIVSEQGMQLSQAELQQRLEAFVQLFAGQQDFAATAPMPLADGGVKAVWSYTARSGTATGRLLVNSFIYQHADKLTLLTFGFPATQFDSLDSTLNTIRGSYTVNPAVMITPGAGYDVVSYSFDDPTHGGWPLEESAALSAAVEEGRYAVTLRAPDSYYLSAPDYAATGDLEVSADVQVVGDARAGVALRLSRGEGQTRSYYACWIDGGDRYGCFVSASDQWTTLAEPASHAAILPGQVNQVTLAAQGDSLTLSVNGAAVASFRDAQLGSGVPALYVENFGAEAAALFDNVSVRTPRR